jgi:succinate dehydrogenase / fumarate reductase, iron-sulfur subunit
MRIVLNVWRQSGPRAQGRFERHEVADALPDMSFLEMLDVLNERLTIQGKEPVAFDSDCREGICGTCGFMINGVAHGPKRATTVCQLHMRSFKDGDELTLEPWRARPFPVLRDLCVDRGAFDRIIAAGGFVSVQVGSPPEANSIPVPRQDADKAMDAAACIGCGACAAACPNGSSMLFTAAKISHLGLLPHGQPERGTRAERMLGQAQAEGFGHCTNIGECEAVCPKEIGLEFIARANRDFIKASMTRQPVKARIGDD